ncbi:MAG: glycosyltransferase family 9 protein [Gammaproteobacteria bacterium]|nr:MAG: glycosyltransferase family 9 protein [Gammaproteobacteria bacterium]
MSEKPRILLVTLSNIGDAVLTTPVLEALAGRWPERRIDLVADRRSAEIFTRAPWLGQIHYRDKRAGWRGLVRLIHSLRRRRYELAVDLRTEWLTLTLRARRRLMRPWGRRAPGHSVVQHFAVVAGPLGLGSPPDPRVWLDEALREEALRRLGPFAGRRVLALGPGANWSGKCWPPEYYARLPGSLEAEFDGVLLLGGPDDRARCRMVAAASPLPVLDLSGQTGLLQACALLEQAAVFVGNDSGLGHMAAAVGTPVVTLFGPGEPGRYHPWGSHCRHLVAPGRELARLPVEQVAAVVGEVAR